MLGQARTPATSGYSRLIDTLVVPRIKNLVTLAFSLRTFDLSRKPKQENYRHPWCRQTSCEWGHTLIMEDRR